MVSAERERETVRRTGTTVRLRVNENLCCGAGLLAYGLELVNRLPIVSRAVTSGPVPVAA